MSSHVTCCGCWPAFVRGFQGSTKTGRTYRRAKYNEREYSIEFENLIEEEDFYAPSHHIVTEVEKDLLSRGKFGELLQHENEISSQQDAKLQQAEENARLEDEAYIQAKKEAARVARQSIKRQMTDKFKNGKLNRFDSSELSNWLAEEKINITSPELDVEDFESFLEKVRAKSAQAKEEMGQRQDGAIFEQSLSQGLEATKIAGDALNALQPVELHAVGFPSKDTLLTTPNGSHENRSYSHDTYAENPSPTINVPPEKSGNSAEMEAYLEGKEIQGNELLNPRLIDVSPTTQVDETVITSSQQPDVIPQSLSHAINVSSTSNASQSSASISQTPLSQPTSTSISQLLQPETMSGENCQPVSSETSLHFAISNESETFDESPLVSSEGNPSQVISDHFEPTARTVVKQSHDERSSSQSNEAVPIMTVATINTPRNVATNLKPADELNESDCIVDDEGKTVGILKGKHMDEEMLDDSLNDNEFGDFDDGFVSANSNGAFEDLLT